MVSPDLSQLTQKLIGNFGCLRLCMVSNSPYFHGRETTGLITFIIEKSLSEFERAERLIQKKRIQQLVRDDPLGLSSEGWYMPSSESSATNYVLVYFFEDFALEAFSPIKDNVYFYPLLENYSSNPHEEIIDRIEQFADYIFKSEIKSPYVVLLFPERMQPYIPDFHVFYERLLLRLKRLPFPSLILSKFPKSANRSFSPQLGFPYSVIFKNLGIDEISFSFI